jgi:hypothetical protein
MRLRTHAVQQLTRRETETAALWAAFTKKSAAAAAPKPMVMAPAAAAALGTEATSAAARTSPQSATVAAHVVVYHRPPALGSATAPLPVSLEHAASAGAATPPAPASPTCTTPKAKRKRKRVGKVLVSGLTNLTAAHSASDNMQRCRCTVSCDNHKAFEPAFIRQVQALSQSAKMAADKERYLMSHVGLVD